MSLKEILARCEQLFEDLDFNAVKQWKAAAPGRKAIGRASCRERVCSTV